MVSSHPPKVIDTELPKYPKYLRKNSVFIYGGKIGQRKFLILWFIIPEKKTFVYILDIFNDETRTKNSDKGV